MYAFMRLERDRPHFKRSAILEPKTRLSQNVKRKRIPTNPRDSARIQPTAVILPVRQSMSDGAATQ